MTGMEILMAVGAVVSAVGQLQAGANAQAAANYNAQVSHQNARAARLAAIEDSKRQRRLATKRQGARRALDPDKLDLLEDNAIEDALEEQSLLHSGEVKAIGFENNAQLEIARGKAAKSSAATSAAFTLITGAGQVAGGSLFPSSSAPLISAPSTVPLLSNVHP
jgi:hypothetical protein